MCECVTHALHRICLRPISRQDLRRICLVSHASAQTRVCPQVFVYLSHCLYAYTCVRAGFDGGRHLTVLRILSMDVHAYIGLTPLPSDPELVNRAHLGLHGFAIGGTAAANSAGNGADASARTRTRTRRAATPRARASTPPTTTPTTTSTQREQEEEQGVLGRSASGCTGHGSGGSELQDDELGSASVRVWLQVPEATITCSCCAVLCLLACSLASSLDALRLEVMV